MGIKINISGVKASGNASIINGANLKGEKVDIGVQDTTIKDDAKVLNEVTADKGKVEVKITGSEIKEQAKALNGINAKEKDLKVTIENVTIDKNTEFMNGTTQSEEKSSTNNQNDKRKPKSKFRMLLEKWQDENEETEVQEETKTDTIDEHKRFEDEISENGKLKGLKTQETETKSINQKTVQQDREV